MPWFWIPIGIFLVVALVVAWFYDRQAPRSGRPHRGWRACPGRDAANDARTRLNDIDDEQQRLEHPVQRVRPVHRLGGEVAAVGR